ncbi:MAG: PHP domain-containing protein [Armatimonadetes bacterium]|nr:PHP domain-containing protein [Armatimonadota bacterium]
MTNELYKRCDLHVHTRLSVCARGEMQLASIISVSEKRGVRYLGITDHVDARVSPVILDEVRNELARIEKPIEVFVGCEADILSVGKHVVTEDMRSQVDFVMVSANHFHDRAVAQPKGSSLEEVGRHFFEMFRYACSLEFADVIAHPLFVFPNTFDPTCLYTIKEHDLAEAIELARANKIAMEISPRALARDQLEFRLRFLSMCKSAGIKFSIGSDAHSLESVGRTAVLAPIIEKVGITDEDIWLPSK